MAVKKRRVTSADVAARAGVSRTTVSFVVNQRKDAGIPADTWRRVEQAARELGYHPSAPARALAGSSTGMIGLIVRQSADQIAADALVAETLWGISSATREAGYRVLVETLDPVNGHYSDLVLSGRVDGLIVSGPRADDEEVGALVADDFPIVVQGSLPGVPVASVDVDNRAGARSAVEHLLELGHTRIGCITNAPLAYTAATERLAGYREALDAAGIPPDPRRIAEGDFDSASGHKVMAHLLDAAPDMTACFVASDVVALGALATLRERRRRVPEDLAVIGFDDIPLARHFVPALSTVRLPARALGVAAGQALLRRLAGQPAEDRTILATELVVRESTMGPRIEPGGT